VEILKIPLHLTFSLFFFFSFSFDVDQFFVISSQKKEMSSAGGRIRRIRGDKDTGG